MAKCRVSIRSPVGADNFMYGSSASNYLQWDASENDLIFAGSAGMSFGTLSSTAQTGIHLATADQSVFNVYADDNNVTLGNGVYHTLRARTMLFKDATGISLFSVKGQIKAADGVDFGPGVYAGVQGYMELYGDTSVQSGAKWWGVDSSIDVPTGKTLTVDSGGIAAGFHAELTGAGTATQSSGGILAGLYIDEQITSGKWGYGIYMTAGSADKAIRVGSLSSDTPGSGMLIDATHTRAVEIHVDDNDTARATGTQGRAIFGRTMIYANNACEDWGVDGLSKVSGVAKTGNVSAGVVGRFESTGTCSLATGAGNTFVAGVMGRLGLAANMTLAAGTWACGVLAFYNTAAASDPTGEYTAAFMATASDIAGTDDWDYGLMLEDCANGIRIDTCSGNGINFPAGETYAKALAYGEFGTPIVYSDDEPFEIHGRLGSATEQKPLFRVRNSAPASTAMTTGCVTGIQAQAYGTDTSNVGGLEALQAHVGIKANCTIIADTGTMPNMRAGFFKIEDLGFDLTLTGDAAVMCLSTQFNAGTTLTGVCDWMFLAKEGTLTGAGGVPDAFVRVYDGTGGGWANFLFDVPASLPYDAANSSGTQSGKIACNVGGATKYIQMYSD